MSFIERKMKNFFVNKGTKRCFVKNSLSIIIIIILMVNLIPSVALNDEVNSIDTISFSQIVEPSAFLLAEKPSDLVPFKQVSVETKKAISKEARLSSAKTSKKVSKTLGVNEKTSVISSRGKDDYFIYYNPKVPMPMEHQYYLYQMCIERKLDYKMMLAVINHESSFDSDNISETDDYGYFQINTCNHEDFSNALNTKNDALDPFVNINWGTYFLSYLYEKYSQMGYTGDNLKEVVLSAYNMGENGFKKRGKAKGYLKLHYRAQKEIDSWFD